MLRSKESVLEIQFANISSKMSRRVRATEGPRQYLGDWRRVRDLRDEEGYEITHTQRSGISQARTTPSLSRQAAPDPCAAKRNGFTCQACGAGPGDPDPLHPGRKIQLTIGHIIDFSKGGEADLGNLRAECTNCNEGLQNTSLPKPSRIELLKQVRRATIDDQLAVLEWLGRKFHKES
jgi:hypothetical protein